MAELQTLKLGGIVILVALALFGSGVSGCALLLASSAVWVGYEGYEYEKTGKLPGVPSNPPATSAHPKAPAPAADDVE
jgi:hypothetical protein